MVMHGIKGMISVLFPLLTFPYLSKIFGVYNLGKYNFSLSIISYVILFAGLGINTYAVREGSRLRDNTQLLNAFSNEIFSINLLSSLYSYVIFLISLYLVPKYFD